MSDSQNPQPALGAAVRSLRAEHKMTQQAVAEAAGVTVAHLSKLERGLTNPTWGTVTAIADALSVRIAELAKRTEVLAAESDSRWAAGRDDRAGRRER